MTNLERDVKLKKPLNISSIAANESFAAWLKENHYASFSDREGHLWNLDVRGMVVPDPEKPKQGVYEIYIDACTILDKTNLLKTGTLQSPDDDRLIGFIGEEKINFHLNTVRLQAQTKEDARQKLSDKITEIMKKIRDNSLIKMKRDFVSIWIDKRKRFGSRV